MKIPTIKKNGYQIVLPIFEGPLDLLLHLIRENKIDIYDIPIVAVTDQYLTYITVMESLDLDVAGEFLVMAATLLEIKSRMLLPPDPKADDDDEEPIDPRKELVDRLIEYQRYKEAAELFGNWEIDRMKVFPGAERDIEIDYSAVMMKNVTPVDLLEALKKILAEVSDGEEEVTTLTRRKVSLRIRMTEVWRRVKNGPQLVLFEELFDEARDRTEVVITFLAILELLKLHRIEVRQDDVFGRIEILRMEEAMEKEEDE